MRYMILDTLLDYASVFTVGFLIMWALHSVYMVLCAWWREGKRDVAVEVLEQDDPRLSEWRRNP